MMVLKSDMTFFVCNSLKIILYLHLPSKDNLWLKIGQIFGDEWWWLNIRLRPISTTDTLHVGSVLPATNTSKCTPL